MKVIPVAGHDSMLLNIGGAHSAYFTRNIVVLTDNAGHTGIGEAPNNRRTALSKRAELVALYPPSSRSASNACKSSLCAVASVNPR